MDYLPVALDLRGHAVLVVGGGEVAARKVALLARAGARVTVLAPALCEELARSAARGALVHRAARWEETGDAQALAGYRLVIAATDEAGINAAVKRAADAAGRFCNVVDDRPLCSFIMPAIVDRSPVQIAISSGGSSPTLARRLRAWLESALPRDLGRVARFAERWRDGARRVLPEPAQRRAFQERLVEGPIAEHVLAGREADASREAARALDGIAQGREASGGGEVRIVGAGPGDAGLLTLHGLQALQWADVILHDRLVSREVLELARRDAACVSVGKASGRGFDRQQEINRQLVEHAQRGLRVVRLKGGDATLFARLGEELAAMRAAGVPCRVIPGVTAAAGCAAYAGMPLTDRDAGQEVSFVTAHGRDGLERLDWPALARPGRTVVFYMGVSRAAHVASSLQAAGAPPERPVAVIASGTTPAQVIRTGRLDGLVELAAGIAPPALILVGEVAAAARDAGGPGPTADPWSDTAWCRPDAAPPTGAGSGRAASLGA